VNSWTYEIFLGGGDLDAAKWREFLSTVADYLGLFASWKIIIKLDATTLHYYLESPKPLPLSFGLADFLLKELKTEKELAKAAAPDAIHKKSPYLNHQNETCLHLVRKLQKSGTSFDSLILNFHTMKQLLAGSAYFVCQTTSDAEKPVARRLALFNPATLLAVNFNKTKNYTFKKFPKYLKIEKVLKLLNKTENNSLFEIDTFPYYKINAFLRHDSYDFAKHSLVLGGSGSGKSKFLASFIDKIYRTAPDQYKIVVIDPHDALKNDCAGIASQKVINFQSPAESIDLFQTNADDINVGVELMLTLFRSLMGGDYNSELERVLRYASFLLMTAGSFSFLHLRELLTDVEYRNGIIEQQKDKVPTSVTRFFLADFNELRTRAYASAIAPIIVFIDEMQMVPVFNDETSASNLADQITHNFLTIFSLSRPRLGNKVTQAIAGLLLQQLFLFAQKSLIDQHLIVIIDEVAIIENPILSRFLSELRKYKTSIMLAGQYFGQFSAELRSAIFANTSNYYIFRVSKSDAELLTHNLNISLAGSDKTEDKQALLTGLKSRECFVQVSLGDETYPGCKGRTLDFLPPAITQTPSTPTQTPPVSQPNQLPPNLSPRSTEIPSLPPAQIADNPPMRAEPVLQLNQTKQFSFSFDASASAADVLRAASTSRKISAPNQKPASASQNPSSEN